MTSKNRAPHSNQVCLSGSSTRSKRRSGCLLYHQPCVTKSCRETGPASKGSTTCSLRCMASSTSCWQRGCDNRNHPALSALKLSLRPEVQKSPLGCCLGPLMLLERTSSNMPRLSRMRKKRGPRTRSSFSELHTCHDRVALNIPRPLGSQRRPQYTRGFAGGWARSNTVFV